MAYLLNLLHASLHLLLPRLCVWPAASIIFTSMNGIDHYITLIVLYHTIYFQVKVVFPVMTIFILFILVMIQTYCVSQNC